MCVNVSQRYQLNGSNLPAKPSVFEKKTEHDRKATATN